MNLTLDCSKSGGAPSVPRLGKHRVTEINRKQQLHWFYQNIHIHTVTRRQMSRLPAWKAAVSCPVFYQTSPDVLWWWWWWWRRQLLFSAFKYFIKNASNVDDYNLHANMC